MLETPKYFTIISTYFKTYLTQILVVAAIAVGYQGWRLYQHYLISHQSQLEKDNEAYKKQIADITIEYNKLASAKKDVEGENIKLAADAEYWRNKAKEIPVPPPTPKPPVEDSVLLADLKDAGAEFKPLQGSLFSTEHSTLPLVWTWNKDSLRVPGLETKLSTTETALDKTVMQVGGLQQQILISDKMLSDADKREALRKTQEVNFTEQIKIKDKQIIIAETNGWIKVGIAVPATYFLTRAIIKK